MDTQTIIRKFKNKLKFKNKQEFVLACIVLVATAIALNKRK